MTPYQQKLLWWTRYGLAVFFLFYFVAMVTVTSMFTGGYDVNEWIRPVYAYGRVVMMLALVAGVWLFSLDGQSRDKEVTMVVICVIAVISIGINAAVTIFNRHNTQIAVKQQMAVYRGMILASGTISPSFDQALRAAAARIPGADKTLVLWNNEGGDIAAQSRAAAELKALGITRVIANGYCVSACAQLWLYGSPRVLTENSVLGFHATAGWSAEADFEPSLTKQRNEQVAELLSQGISKTLIERIVKAQPSQMVYLTHGDLEREGVVVSAEVLPQFSQQDFVQAFGAD